MDTVDKATRSRIMGSVRQKNTQPELVLRKALHAMGYRYKLHDKNLPGSPDLVFPKYKAAIFVHGCFWHRHGCKQTTTPVTRKEFWEEKFKTNIKRDKKNVRDLQRAGWRVLVVWECELKEIKGRQNNKIQKVTMWLKGTRITKTL
jgi:DNA mismatch endonuclease (patch repair protein)